MCKRTFIYGKRVGIPCVWILWFAQMTLTTRVALLCKKEALITFGIKVF